MSTTQAAVNLTEEQRAYVDGFRDLAAFLETHPDLITTTPYCGAMTYRWVGAGADETPAEQVPAEFARLARQLGTAVKGVDSKYINLERKFGPHVLQLTAYRDNVCERVVVGTEEVTEPDPEAVAALPLVTRTVEKVEWVCPPSILNSTGVREPVQS